MKRTRSSSDERIALKNRAWNGDGDWNDWLKPKNRVAGEIS